MAFRLRVDPTALIQIEEFAAYLQEYDEVFAIEQIERLRRALRLIREAPLTWSYFPLTGMPYRAYLFRVGRRTQYWVVYTIDEERNTVDILSFWNAARDPASLDL
jgi:mRNA-degrading endonuclease RelE of RelBE toxin-antitoxin system